MLYDGMIEGLTVDMRSVLPEDADVTWRMRTDKEKVRYMHQVDGTVEDQRRYIVRQNAAPGDYLFLVLDKDGRPVGMRGIYDVKEKSAESGRTIGYGVAFHNMEAMLLGLDFAFDTLGVETVYMDAAEDNDMVRGIQQQLGAEEYDRQKKEGLAYTFVFSRLDKEVYYEKRANLMRFIEAHIRRIRKRG